MGKRSDFERVDKDYYPTPFAAVEPLAPHLPPGARFCEPCAGDGRLIDHLRWFGLECVSALDVEPRAENIVVKSALDIEEADLNGADVIITNPPWRRDILHPMIERCSALRPTWLLFDADWMHTRQSSDLIKRCRLIVSVGRVKWIENSKMTGKDNAAWYLFEATPGDTRFIGR